ncbi:hypothetical protein Tco_0320981 [Tanacetum coccineum]
MVVRGCGGDGDEVMVVGWSRLRRLGWWCHGDKDSTTVDGAAIRVQMAWLWDVCGGGNVVLLVSVWRRWG